MKHRFIYSILSFVLFSFLTLESYGQGNVGIGTNSPDTSAILDIQSTTQGFLLPRMDSIQRVSIANPAQGLMVYETTSKAIWLWDGTTWKRGSISELDDLSDAKTGYMNGNLFGGLNAGNQMQTNGDNNTAWGMEALFSTNTGDDNTAIGQQSLYSNQNGSWNTAVGTKALTNNTGSYNTAVGRESMKFNTTGIDNTAVGSQSLWRNEDGEFNTAIGDQAMLENENGDHNVAVGNNALSKNVEGNFNTAIGSQSLENNLNNFNTAVGYNSLQSNTTGVRNLAIGAFSLHSNISTSDNIAIGDSALYNNGLGLLFPEEGLENVAIGTNAMKNNTRGHGNTSLGAHTYLKDSLGNNNTVIGNKAMRNAIGSHNSTIGFSAMAHGIGEHNVAIGAFALSENTGYANCSIGSGSSASLKNGNENIVIGTAAFNECKLGSGNIVIGTSALDIDTFSDNNLVIGNSALRTNFSSTHNTVLGNYAGFQTQGSGNVFIGYEAGYYEIGSNKLYIDNSDTINPLIWGDFSEDSLTINGYLTSEEKFVAKSNMEVHDIAVFRNDLFVNNSNGLQYVKLDSNSISTKPVNLIDTAEDLWLQTPHSLLENYGNVRIPKYTLLGIGTTNSPSHSLTIEGIGENLFRLIGDGANGSECRLNFGDANFVYIDEPADDKMRVQADKIGLRREPLVNELELEGGASKTTAGSWLANSDRRIKTKIEEIDNSFALMKKLRPVTFEYTDEWKANHPSIENRPYYNFIAQEYGEVFPHSIQGSGEYLSDDKDEILQIDTYDAQIVTMQAVKDLIKENEELKKQIESLNTSMQNLRAELISLIKESAENTVK